MGTNLPTTLLIAGLALLGAACTPMGSAAETAHPYGHNYIPETEQGKEHREKMLADIQQAARECSGMEWYATFWHRHGRKITLHATYPVSEADAGVIRDLLLHKLHTVKYGHPVGLRCDPARLIRCKRLRFLDAGGRLIHEFEFAGFGKRIGKDSDTDANGYQLHTDLSLPDADYETWRNLIPAKMNEDLAKWRKELGRK